MHRRLILSFILATAALGPVAAADGAVKRAPYPSVSKIQPLSLGIGDTLTITGKNFVAGKNKNTVVFKRDRKRAIFVKVAEATKTKLVLVVPEKLRSSLGKGATGKAIPTRFRVRVLSRRFAKKYTSLKTSPRISPLNDPKLPDVLPGSPAAGAPGSRTSGGTTPASGGTTLAPSDCDRDGILDSAEADDDNDKLIDTLEGSIGTDSCKADTDADGIADGWEYKSAFDLNQRSCPDVEYPVPCTAAYPYPAKKPYPNPLYAGDAHQDHDGDWLSNAQEYQATQRHGAIDMANLWYSGGLKASQDSAGDGCRGMSVPPVFDGNNLRAEFRRPDGTYPNLTLPAYQAYTLDNFDLAAGDGCLNDGERDEDGDYLNNVTESGESLSSAQWWADVLKEPIFQVQFEGTNWLDNDSDGDGVLDGLDDQDHDDFLNVEEQAGLRGSMSVDEDENDTGIRTGLWVDPFNPCLPAIYSRTCPSSIAATGEVWRPFWRNGDPPPVPRWPLYNTTIFAGELWNEPPGYDPLQPLPPQHPLPR